MNLVRRETDGGGSLRQMWTKNKKTNKKEEKEIFPKTGGEVVTTVCFIDQPAYTPRCTKQYVDDDNDDDDDDDDEDDEHDEDYEDSEDDEDDEDGDDDDEEEAARQVHRPVTRPITGWNQQTPRKTKKEKVKKEKATKEKAPKMIF